MKEAFELFLINWLLSLFSLMAGFAIFFYQADRRQHFVRRLLLGILAVVLVTVVASATTAVLAAERTYDGMLVLPDVAAEWVAIPNTIYRLLAFGMCIGICQLSFDESMRNIMFLSTAAYAVYGIAYATVDMIGDLFFPAGQVPFVMLYVLTALVYLAAFRIFRKRIRNIVHARELYPGQIILLCAVVVLISSLQYITLPYGKESRVLLFLFSLSSWLCCFLVLYVQFFLLQYILERREKAVIGRIRQQGEKQYEEKKKRQEALDLKYHDLKHQLVSLEQGQAIDRKYIHDMKDLVSMYDTSVRTGNEALDVVLTDKVLLCRQKEIELTCMVDGSALSFMRVSDIYSLFGNALDNAIEYVETLSQEKRIIKCTVTRVFNFVNVQVLNIYEGNPLEMVEGLPRSTKGNDLYHGYGIRSMRKIVESYDGDFMVTVQDGLFTVKMLFPT